MNKSNFVFNYRIRLGRATTLRAKVFLLWQDKFVNGDVSIVLSFIDMQELMFVNVYMSYKTSVDILPKRDEVKVFHQIVLGTISTITERSIHG